MRVTRSAVTSPPNSVTPVALARADARARPPSREARALVRPLMISIPEREALPSAPSRPSLRTVDAGDVAEVAGRDARLRRGARGRLRLRGREQHEGGQHGGRGERGDRHAHRPSLADVGIRSVAMEAATSTARLSGEKAQRIVDAMRTCVGERGATGATFDHVARAAGVSRGLLHYYFGTKEKLLAEVVRRDCDLRMERLSATAAGLRSPDDLLEALSGSLVELIEESPEFFAILLELHVVGRHNEEIAAEVAELHRRVRGHLALILTAARDAGVITLSDEPEVVSETLFVLADGLALWMLAEPGRDFGPTVAAATRAAAALILPA